MAGLEELATQLLLTSFSAKGLGQPAAAAEDALQQGLALVRSGQYLPALTGALRGLWTSLSSHSVGSSAAPECTPDWFDALRAALRAAPLRGPASSNGAASERTASLALLAAVAALYLWAQANLCGPAITLPECPFDLLDEAETAAAETAASAPPPAPGAAATKGGFGRDSISPGDR